jgi:hypothetical protein
MGQLERFHNDVKRLFPWEEELVGGVYGVVNLCCLAGRCDGHVGLEVTLFSLLHGE